jgi:hypothetical protein
MEKTTQLKKDLGATSSGYDAGKLFKKYGWNLLGSGADGAVADYPNKNIVLKLFVKKTAHIPNL